MPRGVHRASEAEVVFRFGTSTKRRRQLTLRLRHWLELSRNAGASRFLLDGSYVTAKPNPKDIDAVVKMAMDFDEQVGEEVPSAVALSKSLGKPGDFFLAQKNEEWYNWVEFFSRTRAHDRRRKGIVEVVL